MMMAGIKKELFTMSLLALLLLTLMRPAGLAQSGEITGQALSASIQYAELSYAERSRGWDPVLAAQYELGMDRLAMAASLAFGPGWDVQARRFDLGLGASYDFELFLLGGGWRVITSKTSNWVEEEWYYHGPELFCESGVEFEDVPLNFVITAALMPYVFAGYENNVCDKQTESTWGFSIDGKFALRVLENMDAAVGYRFRQFHDKDISTPYSDAPTLAERVHGPYVECRLYW